MKEIVYRHKLDRPPSAIDRLMRTGLYEFEKKLTKRGWIDEQGVSNKTLKIEYITYSDGDNNHYIEWRASLTH